MFVSTTRIHWSPMSRSATAVAIAAAVLGATLGACSSAPAPVRASPDIRAAATGLEVRWWVIDNAPQLAPLAMSPNALRRLRSKDIPTAKVSPPNWRELLEPYADRPVPVPEAARERWRANGLRLYSVPVRDLSELRSRLRIVGPVQDRWFGQAPVWTEAVRGAQLARVDAITLDTGVLRVEGGVIRLLTRAWIVPGSVRSDEQASGSSSPGADGGERAAVVDGGKGALAGRGSDVAGLDDAMLPAMLQLEILPQHHVVPQVRDEITTEPERPVPPQEQGLAFERLELRTLLGADDALVIVPDRPDTDESQDGGPSPGAAGPGPPRQLTLGEALLTDKPARGAATSLVFVVLVPKVPATYNLLAP